MRNCPLWINGFLSKMNTMVKDVDDNLANYRIPEAAKCTSGFRG